MSVVTYNIGEPIESGVYACRVPRDLLEGLYEDIFLLWHRGRWSYLGSAENYRGTVPAWIGPLKRRPPFDDPSTKERTH
jgi:hypothetical protein